MTVLAANPDGVIEALHVVGFHGRLGQKQTPVSRAPVYIDHLGRPARIRSATARAVTVELGQKPIPADVWETTGTHLGVSWPATVSASRVLVLGERELDRIECIRDAAGATGMASLDAAANAVLDWVRDGDGYSAELRCAWVGDLLAWNCSRGEELALRSRIAVVARQELEALLESGTSAQLLSASFWLLRVSPHAEDIRRAISGLRAGGHERWRDVLAAVEAGL